MRCSTCCLTRSSAFISMIVIERSSLLTASFTSSCSESNCSFPCCRCDVSSSKFAWREIFSCYAARHYSTSSPFTCFKAWEVFSISSCAHRRRDSIVSTSQWSWAGSSPNFGSPDGRGALEWTEGPIVPLRFRLQSYHTFLPASLLVFLLSPMKHCSGLR
jgi:hypothetical protein